MSNIYLNCTTAIEFFGCTSEPFYIFQSVCIEDELIPYLMRLNIPYGDRYSLSRIYTFLVPYELGFTFLF